MRISTSLPSRKITWQFGGKIVQGLNEQRLRLARKGDGKTGSAAVGRLILGAYSYSSFELGSKSYTSADTPSKRNELFEV